MRTASKIAALINREVKRVVAETGLPEKTAREGVKKEAGRRGFREWQRQAIWDKGGGKCAGERDGKRCGHKFRSYDDYWHADHVIPRSAGGATLIENGQVLCWVCNLQKGSEVD